MIKYSTYWKLINWISLSCIYGRIHLSSISYARFINLFGLIASYAISAMIKRPVVWGNPLSVSIEPINVCNLKCPECPTGMGIIKRPKGMISADSFNKILGDLGKSLWHINLYFQGEPLMHPDFFQLVEMAKEAKLVTSTSTNAHFLSYPQAIKTVASGLDNIIVSFDGITQEVYEKYRVGGNINTVLQGVRNLVKAKREFGSDTPVIVAQFLVFNHNEHQLDEFKELAFGLGVNQVDIKTAQIYQVDKKVNMLPINSSLSRYSISGDGSVQLKGSIKNRCWKHWSSAVITWDGRVAPCCFDKDAKYTFGNALQGSFNQVWTNSDFNNFRQKILVNKKQIDICSNCPVGRK